MRELYDADVWRIKETFRTVVAVAAVAVSVGLLLMGATDF
jgi:hypothetical protein